MAVELFRQSNETEVIRNILKGHLQNGIGHRSMKNVAGARNHARLQIVEFVAKAFVDDDMQRRRLSIDLQRVDVVGAVMPIMRSDPRQRLSQERIIFGRPSEKLIETEEKMPDEEFEGLTLVFRQRIEFIPVEPDRSARIEQADGTPGQTRRKGCLQRRSGGLLEMKKSRAMLAPSTRRRRGDLDIAAGERLAVTIGNACADRGIAKPIFSFRSNFWAISWRKTIALNSRF
ncbi:MAG: hypothetical protein U1E20_08990 [Methylocystis sp.]|uniref:hypothetical protein n=1 Tax=Methylocystis sp. TaxID=1911079 RepID=UPI003932FD4E